MAYPQWVGKVLAADRVRSTAGEVNVQWYGADGNAGIGAVAVTTAAVASAQAVADLTGRGLYFPLGAYYLSAGLLVTRPQMSLRGDVGTEIHMIGAGPILTLDGGVGPIVGVAMFECNIENLILVGTALATRGIWLRNVNQSTFTNIRVEDVTEAALYLETATSNLFTNFACTVNRRFFATQPNAGIYLTKRAGDPHGVTSMNVWVNPMIEGLDSPADLAQGYGLHLVDGTENAFLGGTLEGNRRDIKLEADALVNYFTTITLVKNAFTQYSISCAGGFNVFETMYVQSTVTWEIGARGNTLARGAYFDTITNLSALEQCYDHPVINNAAALVDPVTVNAADRRYWDQGMNAWSSA